ncbi:claudin-34 [Polypterus senegalus]
MAYLADTANLQIAAFWLGTVGWILSAITTGLIEWRVWYVPDNSVITSGVAWVGIWRVCFFSHQLVSSEYRVMFCQSFSALDSFVPVEVYVAQALMIAAIMSGAAGKAASICAFRSIFFGMTNARLIRIAFSLGGTLYMFASVCVVVAVGWNLNSVATNQSIAFPASYYMPASPASQEPGAAIGVGLTSSILLMFSGIIFLTYRLPHTRQVKVFPTYHSTESLDCVSVGSSGTFYSRSLASAGSARRSATSAYERDNPAFQSHEHL